MIFKFIRALSTEYKSKGIIVQNLVPFYVATKLSRQNVSWLIPTPNDYVKSAVRTVGKEESTHGYLSHELQVD